MLGRDLDKALADAGRAVRLRPGVAAPLNARGMARLRRGELDRAVADYDAALKAQPRYAWALYGRGVAKLRKGMAADGQADVAAAVVLDARIANLGRRFGVAADMSNAATPGVSPPAPVTPPG